MRLTGKAEKDFFEWYRNTDFKSRNQPGLALFYNYCNSMQYGVLVDFFESKDLCIEICKMHLSKYYYWMINDGDEENKFNTRPEARTESIKKANEIYNLR